MQHFKNVGALSIRGMVGFQWKEKDRRRKKGEALEWEELKFSPISEFDEPQFP